MICQRKFFIVALIYCALGIAGTMQVSRAAPLALSGEHAGCDDALAFMWQRHKGAVAPVEPLHHELKEERKAFFPASGPFETEREARELVQGCD